jgi:dTDP-4-amino-4,6-dideoxygalactose transaminase
MPTLAVNGGEKVRQRPWPQWPIVTERSEALLLDALRSGRWAVSGAFVGSDPYEQRFAALYAAYNGVPYCVPTCHGSSALVVALEALGVGPEHEVLVPGLTWVACASAVSGLGAVPILIDIDPDTLCMSADAAEAGITDRTGAIMVVHSFGSTVDLDRFVALARRTGVPLLEDFSQAHGALWRGRRVGSFGAVGACSFQQTKLLSAGEGGATLTSDPLLYDRMQQLRADGRRYTVQPRIGHFDLEEIGAVQGRNFCMSELHAALLVEGLERLDAENAHRRGFVAKLEDRLAECDGVSVQARPEGLTSPSFYHLCLRFDPDAFDDFDIDFVANALKYELDLGAIDPVDTPLNRNRLYNPLLSPRTPRERAAEFDPARFSLPLASRARETCLTIPHNALLGDDSDIEDIVAAIEKVRHALSRRVMAEASSAA